MIKKAGKSIFIGLLCVLMTGMTIVESGYKFSERDINENKSYGTINIKIPFISDSSNNNIKEFNGIIEGDITDWEKDIVELAKQDEAESKSKGVDFRPYSLDTTYKVPYNTKDFVSLVVDYYQFTGGAHGLTTRNTYNYDFVKGRRLRLFELFKDGYDYQTKINNIIKQEIAKKPDEYFQDQNGFKGIKNKQDFYIDNNGIVIVFQLYEIAPYVAGIREFHIPFSQLQDGLLYKFQ
ncbi:DUF3298 and DUF4163 domain-containing protein [Clostridium manihotivorum]|uniref:DUF3298/DUF4163 domain-containing protein n=1 Tax=Clostridium manihotivorum TaxID=2320868 RepID=A0A3R5U7N7_9CLOT|nr:DUF3298 and DUF4163 domain-containing protein [Clostridium manihotivorum]QAA30972.1 DUF3298/DUF4163 domain-containing protein [Clostridium manihotivorum]